ncbi:hypothetical protein M3I01_000605 [Marinomonas sp. RSW2]|uniref:Uncharacterized protein n=1 Tax=Marinomonas maritima TaxID=2940935 RepID=A0ABT5W9D4_9GAMM|nr:hypothetical protein [Marinomonas maritima]MDE8601429.1 hypothetical protein [Marinomonas maritima]
MKIINKMRVVNNLPHLSTKLCSIWLFLSFFSAETMALDINASSEIKAVVYIASPKVGTLLQLRGIAGKGVLVSREVFGKQIIVKQQDNTHCVAAPIRFAAGDFGGSAIGIQSIDSIRLLIYSDKVANRLIAGDEIVSEDYDITDQSDARLGDIKIESGLTLSYGFVLNPGEWSWSSMFGLDKQQVTCPFFQDGASLYRPT